MSKLREKSIYIYRLCSNMRSAGQNNWLQYDMADLCEIAGLWNEWLNTVNRNEEEELAISAANKLGYEIRHILV